MFEYNADGYQMVNPAWYWLFNYKNQCWDKAETGLDGSITVYQWDKKLKKYTRTGTFKSVDYTLYHTPTENDYAYWYARKSSYQSDPMYKTEYEDPNKEKDNSLLGQVWKWSGSEWIKVSETGAGQIDASKDTYIIAHGLRNSYKEAWISSMAEALDDKGQVLCIDWGDESLHDDFASGDYNASHIDDAAVYAALLLSQVMQTSGVLSNGKVSLDGFESKITMVGHSFGAHLSAYFANYVNGRIKCIQGLDSAEEDTQANPIILGSGAASDVFFYKSSDILGGGDTWTGKDSLLGGVNLYVVSLPYELSAEDGLSTGTLDTSEHGYAHSFFTKYMGLSDGDRSIHNQILEDIKKVGVKWHGVVNGSNMQMDCVNMGYYLSKNVLTQDSGWSYSDYNAAVARIVGKMNATFADIKDELDMPAEIYAVACLTALDVQDLKVNGIALAETMDKTAPAAVKVKTNKQFSIDFTVKNFADNISFEHQDLKNAQMMQQMTHEIWLSSSETFAPSNPMQSVRLYSSLYDSGNEELYSIGALGSDDVQATVAVDHVSLMKWIESNSDLKEQYQKTGAVDVYVHVRAGVDGNNSAAYIPGELQSNDNALVQKISVEIDPGDWQWRYNFRTKCWDKLAKLEDGSYIAYQWNASAQNWTNVKYLKAERFGSANDIGAYSDDEFGYFYTELSSIMGHSFYEDEDRNKDRSVPGLIWVWQKGDWAQVTEDVFREETYENTYIIIHGLRNTIRTESTEWMENIASSLAARDKNARILGIDWGDWADGDLGGQGDLLATGIDNGAERSATMLAQLIGNYYTAGQVNISSLGDVHLIGHSYGAHYSAYLSGSMLGQTVKNLYALDAAQTFLQVNDTKLNPSSADNVYFYKSSTRLGGEKEFGDFNFYTVSRDGQLASPFHLLSVELLDTEAHSYATQFFNESIQSSIYSGFYFSNQEYFDDFSAYRNTWQGIVNGAHDGRIECVTIGYEKDEYGWTVADYMSTVQNCHTGADVIRYSLYRDAANTASAVTGGYAMHQNLYFNKYLVDYAVDSERITINGQVAGDRGVEIEYGEDVTIRIPVKNWADNTSFGTDEVLDAQELQNSTCNVWISPYASGEGGSMYLWSSTDLSDVNSGVKYHEELLVAPGEEVTYNYGLVLTESDVENILSCCGTQEQIDKYHSTGKAELYVYVQAGAQEDSSSFIKGELSQGDNWSSGQKIIVEKEKTGIQTIFVIDISGSMGEEIARVRSGLLDYINNLRKSSDSDIVPTMQLVTFKQPRSNGTEYQHVHTFTTNSLSEMAAEVGDLRADGGYYSYENSNHALKVALNNIAQGGNIILATDEPAAPGVNVNSLIRLANRKSVTVHSIISGYLTSHQSYVPTVSAYSEQSDAFASSPATVLEKGDVDQNADDEINNATSISVGQFVENTLNYGSDRYDWYKINLTKHYEYTIRGGASFFL